MEIETSQGDDYLHFVLTNQAYFEITMCEQFFVTSAFLSSTKSED